MNIEKQVCSLELAKQLKELGVEQESLFYWEMTIVGGKIDYSSAHIVSKDNKHQSSGDPHLVWISAPLASELGEMLPEVIKTKEGKVLSLQSNIKWWVGYGNLYKGDEGSFALTQTDKNEANARAKMLLYLIKNHLLPITNKE